MAKLPGCYQPITRSLRKQWLCDFGIATRKELRRGQAILNWMGTEKLADNLFRQVQAEARIRREDAASREEANRIHHQVGQQARRFIIEDLEGTPPELLPTPAEGVQAVRSREQRRLQAGRLPSLFPREDAWRLPGKSISQMAPRNRYWPGTTSIGVEL